MSLFFDLELRIMGTFVESDFACFCVVDKHTDK